MPYDHLFKLGNLFIYQVNKSGLPTNPGQINNQQRQARNSLTLHTIINGTAHLPSSLREGNSYNSIAYKTISQKRQTRLILDVVSQSKTKTTCGTNYLHCSASFFQQGRKKYWINCFKGTQAQTTAFHAAVPQLNPRCFLVVNYVLTRAIKGDFEVKFVEKVMEFLRTGDWDGGAGGS